MAITGYLLMFPFYGTDIGDMQLAQMVHGIVAMLFVALMLAHIYIGSIGMEGAFEAMGTGTSTSTGPRSTTGCGSRRRWRAPGRTSCSASRWPSRRNSGRRIGLNRIMPGGLYPPGMRIIGLAGWSGAGKTTLLAKLIPRWWRAA